MTRRPALAARLISLVWACAALATGPLGMPSPVRAQPPGPDKASSSSSELPPLELVRGLRRARLAHDRGETAEELSTLRAVAEAHPDEMVVTYALLEYHRHPGTDDEPVLFGAAQDLAWIHRDFGEDEEAEALFRRALELQPDDTVSKPALAELYASDEERTAAATARAASRRSGVQP